MKKYKVVYDSDICGTNYVDELFLSDSENISNFIDEEMYRDEMDIPDDVDVSVVILDENDEEFDEF